MTVKKTGNISVVPGPGRPKGSPNRTTAALKEALLQSFDDLGGVKWLTALAQTDPGTYARLLARLIPTETAGSLEVTMPGPITEIRRTVVDPRHDEQV